MQKSSDTCNQYGSAKRICSDNGGRIQFPDNHHAFFHDQVQLLTEENQREKTDKKQGAQNGHPGTTMKMVEHPDQILEWVHVCSNPLFTHFAIHPKQGWEAMNAIGILPNYTGIAVHDRFKSYDNRLLDMFRDHHPLLYFNCPQAWLSRTAIDSTGNEWGTGFFCPQVRLNINFS